MIPVRTAKTHDFATLTVCVCEQTKAWQQHNKLRLVFEDKSQTENKRLSQEEDKKVERLGRGRTSPSCKSNYPFYDFNESLMGTNKRSSKTDREKRKKRERDVLKGVKGKNRQGEEEEERDSRSV